MGEDSEPVVRKIFILRRDDVENLEKLRVALGLRSHAAVVRKLIRDTAKEKLK
jgi:hypothetical protein